MSEAGNEPLQKRSGHKRKRVAKACHTCRAMKNKCDGGWPECSRCKGYGYHCAYDDSGLPRHGSFAVQSCGELRNALAEYRALVERLASDAPDHKAPDTSDLTYRVNTALSSIEAALVLRGNDASARKAPQDEDSPVTISQVQVHCSERYLGEVSDVQFFNLVKRVLQMRNGSTCAEQQVDSYEQDDDVSDHVAAAKVESRAVELPDPDKLKSLTDIYFTTIHLAYPFIPGTMFANYLSDARSSVSRTQLAMLYVICAIGAYYNSFPGNEGELSKVHDLYFARGLSLAPPAGTDRSIDSVALLLAQCFYLLAVCRTDSCWTTLGQAVRTAQSIGLHVEPPGPSLASERRRRTWYSLYVLDRLLSLQLGRPPAIHDQDCDVPLPSRIADSDIDWDEQDMPADNPAECSAGDYFLAVISFSKIVGHVLRDLYSPKAARGTRTDLDSTRNLDQQLTQWKSELPRSLRFDLGHVFNQSIAFKRQRNMLAVKYHHLRALTHRPYLCYPLLRNLDAAATGFAQSNWPLISLYERKCISEARAMARLLHGISNQKDLVHDFPWWQMISCLVCAGSILLISSIFARHTSDETDGLDAEGLSDDAETCMRVFEALSTNSTGARIARGMMEKLKESGGKWTRSPGSPSPFASCEGPFGGLAAAQVPALTAAVEDGGLEGNVLPTPSDWPAEIFDSMAWSAQFFSAAQYED